VWVSVYCPNRFSHCGAHQGQPRFRHGEPAPTNPPASRGSGRYDRHLVALRKRYAHKARVMRDALEKHFPRK